MQSVKVQTKDILRSCSIFYQFRELQSNFSEYWRTHQRFCTKLLLFFPSSKCLILISSETTTWVLVLRCYTNITQNAGWR